jgi:hypothetical protein
MKRAINLANRLERASVLDLERDIERDGLSRLSRDAIGGLREQVVLREIIVIDSCGKAVRTPQRASGCDDRVTIRRRTSQTPPTHSASAHGRVVGPRMVKILDLFDALRLADRSDLPVSHGVPESKKDR